MKFSELYRNYSFHHPETIKEQMLQQALYEGLILSVAPKQMAQLIHNLRTSGKVTYDRKYASRVLDVTFVSPVPPIQITSVFERTKAGGWFWAVANIFEHRKPTRSVKTESDLFQELQTLPNKSKIQLVFEAKYGYDVTANIVSSWEYLYHVTPKKNFNKILTKGLSPKTQGKQSNHPERIYFATSIHDIQTYLLPEFARVTNTNIDDWAILQIRCAAFEQKGVRVFDDPAFPGGVYTLSNISPSFITAVE